MPAQVAWKWYWLFDFNVAVVVLAMFNLASITCRDVFGMTAMCWFVVFFFARVSSLGSED